MFIDPSTSAAIFAASVSCALAGDISGAGATFPIRFTPNGPTAYKKETGVGLNYQSIGSGGGIKQIKAKTVTFGASDMPLEAEGVEDAAWCSSRWSSGGDVPVVNLDGVGAGRSRLDGPTLAKIFLGQITKWDDPAINKLNPKVKLPSARDRRRAPLGRFGDDVHLHRTICPRTARTGSPSRRQHCGGMAGRHRRQRQRGRRE